MYQRESTVSRCYLVGPTQRMRGTGLGEVGFSNFKVARIGQHRVPILAGTPCRKHDHRLIMRCGGQPTVLTQSSSVHPSWQAETG